MIDKDKTYTTRNGREVRIYATDAKGAYPVHGAIKNTTSWESYMWTQNGNTYVNIDDLQESDLIEVKLKKPTLKAFEFTNGEITYCTENSGMYRRRILEGMTSLPEYDIEPKDLKE